MANIYDRIADPTQGRLGDIGTQLLQIKQLQIQKEAQDLDNLVSQAKFTEQETKNLIDENKLIQGVSSTILQDFQKTPELMTDPQKYGQYMQTVTQGMPENIVANFRGLLPPQIEQINRRSGQLVSRFEKDLKGKNPKKITEVTRVDDKGNIYKKDTLYQDGDVVSESPEYPSFDGDEGSEFERHISWFKRKGIPMDESEEWYAQNLPNDIAQEAIVRKKRTTTRAGLEQTRQQELTYASTEEKRTREAQDDIFKTYAKNVDSYKSMTSKVESAIIAMESGDTGLADTLMAQTLSQVQESDVRAFAMYSQFDKSFGNVLERTVKGVRRFLEGKRTPGEREEIKKTLEYMRDNYSVPKTEGMRNLYRARAVERNLDPFETIPPDSAEDIRDSNLISKERKLELLRRYYPDMFTK